MGGYVSFNPEITLGNLLIAASMMFSVAGAYFSLKGRMEVFSTLIEAHNKRVDRMELAAEARLVRLENNDIRLTDIVQELIGQNNERIRWDGRSERRDHERRS